MVLHLLEGVEGARGESLSQGGPDLCKNPVKSMERHLRTITCLTNPETVQGLSLRT